MQCLEAERNRRRYAISDLRRGDMGEQVTNTLMEKLSDDPGLLFRHDGLGSMEDPSFDITEVNIKGGITLTTAIGSIEMSDIMAARLRSLYVTHHPVRLLTPEYLAGFSRASFMLLYRYNYIDPQYKRQGYLAPQYFEAIADAFGMPIDLEAFASAINTTAPRYCSLFPDVEAPFGSLGSFFDLQEFPPDTGLVQCSPPRIGRITMQAVEHSAKLVLTADREETAVVLLTPAAWDDVSRAIDNTGICAWKNRPTRSDTIEYRNVVRNLPARYPHPRVSVLCKRKLHHQVVKKLQEIF